MEAVTTCPARVLVVDCVPGVVTAENMRYDVRPYGEIYPAALTARHAGLETFVLAIADGETLPQGMTISDFDGVAFTGSPLSAYDEGPEVTRQIAFARDVFASGVPSFGSCWGLQIMAAALGGEVRPNPKGYEIGIARDIRVTPAGHAHPMLAAKGDRYAAIAIHRDEVIRLPKKATLLAGNDMSAIQAVEIEDGGSSFWGVQYHPEFTLSTIAGLIHKLRARLVKEGLCLTERDALALAQDWRALDRDPKRRDVAWKYGLGPDILDAEIRCSELSAWIDRKVLPHAAARS